MDPGLNNYTLVDSHCHLPLLKEPLESVLLQCREHQVGFLLNVGYDQESSEDSVALTKYDGVNASVGIHPHYANGNIPERLNWLENLIESKQVVAIGEIGLDTVKSSTSRISQIEWLKGQLAIAQKRNLPVIIHNRSADEDIENVLSLFPTLRGVLHCFSSSVAFGTRMANKGWYLSFSGNITYPKSDELRQMLAQTPVQQLLLETDSPYLTPVPFRGKKENSPAMIPEIYAFAANTRKVSLPILAEQILQNYQTLFLGNKERVLCLQN